MKKVSDGGWDYEIFNGNTNVGVVLVHEIMGLDDYIRDVAHEFANNGVSVAAVDLYHGKYEMDFQKAFALRGSVTREALLDCMRRAHAILGKEINSSSAVVGAMGFCMGGGFALYSACHLDFGFIVVYYGSMDEVDDMKDLRGPVMLVEGLESERDMTWVRDRFVPSTIKYKKRVEMEFYPNAGHAFHRPGTERHNTEASKDCWNKTLAFALQFKK